MKGIIFNLFEAFVSERWGEEAYEALQSECHLKTDEPFVGPGTYPDEDLTALVIATSERFELSAAETLRLFGRFCLPKLLLRFPKFAANTDARSFLRSVEGVIHVEVRKLMDGAYTPTFEYEEPGPDELTIRYSSKRKLCHFMEGLIDGVADAFDTSIRHHQKACVHAGGEACEFHLTFGA